MLDDVRSDPDHWRNQAEATQRLLADAAAKRVVATPGGLGPGMSKLNSAALLAGLERALANDTQRPVTRRQSPLSDEQRLQHALGEIERLRAELRLEHALGEIERVADNLRKLAG